MKPGYVGDEFEYQISRIVLMQFICSTPVLAAAEGKLFIVLRILKFLRGYVYAHEGLYLYYLRKRLRTFFTSHSSAHEVSFVYTIIRTCIVTHSNLTHYHFQPHLHISYLGY